MRRNFTANLLTLIPSGVWPKPVAGGRPTDLNGRGLEVVCQNGLPNTVTAGFPLIDPISPVGSPAVREQMEQYGRSMDQFDLSVITGEAFAGESSVESRIQELLSVGANRILFLIEPDQPDAQWPVLERHAKLIASIQ